MICHGFLVLQIRPSWWKPSCGRGMGRDAWEADSTALTSAWQCFFSSRCLAAFVGDEQDMGLEFSWRIEEMTELVWNGACGCVSCTIAAGLRAAFTASFCCVEQGGKEVGDLNCDLRAVGTCCVCIYSANTAEWGWALVWDRLCPKCGLCLHCEPWLDWLMELALAAWSVSGFPLCYIHRLLCRTSKLSF